MRQAWRWYGPNDPVTLDHVRQAGAHEVVTALHQYAPDEAWPRAAVAERKALIENAPVGRAPLRWTVVESIPVPDDILRGIGRRVARESTSGSSMPAGGRGRGHPHHLLQRDAGRRLDPHRSRFSARDRRDRAALRSRPLRGVRSACPAARRRRSRLRRGNAGARTQGRRRSVASRSRPADQEHFGRTPRRDNVIAEPRGIPRADRELSRTSRRDQMRANVAAFLAQGAACRRGSRRRG